MREGVVYPGIDDSCCTDAPTKHNFWTKKKDEEHPHPRPGSKHECNEPYERSYQSRYTLFVDGRITFSVKCSITRRLYSFPQKQKMLAADFNEMELIDSMIGASQESKISDGETVFSN